MQGSLEQSNVDIVEEMVGMIGAQRSYEINSKVISTADDMLRAASADARLTEHHGQALTGSDSCSRRRLRSRLAPNCRKP